MAELRELANGRADLLAEVAGILEGASEGELDEPLAAGRTAVPQSRRRRVRDPGMGRDWSPAEGKRKPPSVLGSGLPLPWPPGGDVSRYPRLEFDRPSAARMYG